ncbi:MAG: fumarylacetoacetate hydrolase family protein [Lentisphaerae bacterium]|nr:fumarylacetoacetate hydrolase family protein [Lentisphaerota bacterium]
MKLIRFGERGSEKPGVLMGNDRRDCSAHVADWNAAFFRADGLRELATFLEVEGARLPAVPPDTRWAPCVARPGKIVCVGLNYADHAAETGAPIPTEPVIFLKAPNSVCGPFDPLLIPRGSQKMDWEVELALVIGREARYVPDETAAAACVAGYCLANDVSERAFQREHGGQWTKGKSCDTFCPLGPFLATPDEIADPQALALTTDVNGERMQSGNTRTMLFTVRFLVHYLSQFLTLEPGDLVSTGTPPGVGMGHQPPRFLKAGDIVEQAIDGLGRQRHHCLPA